MKEFRTFLTQVVGAQAPTTENESTPLNIWPTPLPKSPVNIPYYHYCIFIDGNRYWLQRQHITIFSSIYQSSTLPRTTPSTPYCRVSLKGNAAGIEFSIPGFRVKFHAVPGGESSEERTVPGNAWNPRVRNAALVIAGPCSHRCQPSGPC